MTVTLDGAKIATDLLQVVRRQNDTIAARFGSRPRLALISIPNLHELVAPTCVRAGESETA
jgi:hypothetical protein